MLRPVVSNVKVPNLILFLKEKANFYSFLMSSERKNDSLSPFDCMKIKTEGGRQPALGSPELQMPQTEGKPGWAEPPSPSSGLAAWAAPSLLVQTAPAGAFATLGLRGGPVSQTCSSIQWLLLGRRNPAFRSTKPRQGRCPYAETMLQQRG